MFNLRFEFRVSGRLTSAWGLGSLTSALGLGFIEFRVKFRFFFLGLWVLCRLLQQSYH